MTEKGAINMVIAPATTIAVSAAEKGTMITATIALISPVVEGGKMLYNEYRKRQREKTNKILEPTMNKALQDLKNKIKALREDFRKSEESTKNEFQIFREEVEKNQGNKEMKIVLVLLSMFDNNLQELSQKIQTLEEDVQKWPETTKRELQLLRGDLENQGKKDKEIATELKSKLDENFDQLSQKIQTLEENAQKWAETTKRELQLLRGDLENQVKEEQSSRAQQCRMETLLKQLFQGFQSLQQTLQLRPELLYHEFQLFRGYLENDQGIAMQREEIIYRRVLGLAGGERINNMWTDSRSAFGIGTAQGAVQNRRLHEARGFFRSVSGGEVEQITPGDSDNLHANQDQTACLDSLFRSIEGIQRSMDMRASRTNDLQVLMLTLGVLISIIILARIFTLPWL